MIVLPSQTRLTTAGPNDPGEGQSPSGDDCIPTANRTINIADRLANAEPTFQYLGNGPFGGAQGDVDFYAIDADPGQLVAVHMADTEQPPTIDHPIRSYLALLDSDGCVLADLDYSLEHRFDIPFAFDDGVADEIAATLAATVPPDITGDVFLMVGIDNGNLLRGENMPFNPMQPGTTLSRRFETKNWQPREYALGVAVLGSPPDIGIGRRLFVVPQRGLDDHHTSCVFGYDPPTDDGCFPPIMELNPITGQVIEVLSGEPSFGMTRALDDQFFDPIGRQSNNPLIAYDGTNLYVTVEGCVDAVGVFCFQVNRPLYRINPNLQPTQAGYISFVGVIAGYPADDVLTGMTELGGNLYALNTDANALRYWNKTTPPAVFNGGTLTPVDPDPANADLRWDDLDGDIASDLTDLYVPCTYQGEEWGICIFRPNPAMGTITQIGKLSDPVTNPHFVPGPRLGGIGAMPGVVVTSDQFGSVVQYWTQWHATDPGVPGAVTAMELPRGFVVRRLTIR
ncbi:MAG: hypothetical protein HOP29_04805 [Phycisphaerales bacterium]|nr:hypothetical protein [Phycisphaerales bacterium]